MSPYVITTRKPVMGYGSPDLITRRAVATLDEARHLVQHIMLDHAGGACSPWPEGSNVDNWTASESLPESGGSVGPLPDGTTIEVQEVSPLRLAALSDGRVTGELLFECAKARDFAPAVAAFNGTQR